MRENAPGKMDRDHQLLQRLHIHVDGIGQQGRACRNGDAGHAVKSHDMIGARRSHCHRDLRRRHAPRPAQRIAAAFIGKAQAHAFSRHRHPHELADGDIGGIGVGRHTGTLPGLSSSGRSSGARVRAWPAAGGQGDWPGSRRAGTGVRPGGNGVGTKPQAPIQVSLPAGQHWRSAPELRTAAGAKFEAK